MRISKERAMELVPDSPVMRKPMLTPPDRGQGVVVQVFTNVNMGKGHDGLAAICAQFDIDVAELVPGQYVVFSNRMMDKVKIFGANNVVSYLKLPPGSKISLGALALMPLAFHGSPDIKVTGEAARFLGVQAQEERRASPEVIVRRGSGRSRADTIDVG